MKVEFDLDKLPIIVSVHRAEKREKKLIVTVAWISSACMKERNS
jgi:hypothetical protein